MNKLDDFIEWMISVGIFTLVLYAVAFMAIGFAIGYFIK